MQLTHLQAWEKIRAAFETYPNEDTTETDYLLTVNGLCFAVRQLWSYDLISVYVFSLMQQDINKARPDGCIDAFTHYWPRDKEGADARVLAINSIIKRISEHATNTPTSLGKD